MNIQIYSKGIELTAGLRESINNTFAKLESFGVNGTVHVKMNVRHGEHIVDVTVNYANYPKTIHGSGRSRDMYVSIDSAYEVLETQISKIRSKANKIKRDDIRNYTDESIDSE